MITILKHGMLDTIQDLGRYGLQKFGVVTSGPMDMQAHRIANILVGNEENSSTIEVTVIGPQLQFNKDSIFALCGANLQPTIDGVPVPMWRPVFVKKNTILKFSYAINGSRAYIAVGGGYVAPKVMNSQSTYLRAKIGGIEGRALHRGDQIALGEKTNITQKLMKSLMQSKNTLPFQTTKWFVPPTLYSQNNKPVIVHVTKGKQYEDFTVHSRESFTAKTFTVQTDSDRMGYRLNGPHLKLTKQKEMISEAVSFGSIQVPSDGNPIILTADRQTTGGYPKIAQVSASDFSALAQAKPGDELLFKLISMEESQSRYIKMERRINQLERAIKITIWGN